MRYWLRFRVGGQWKLFFKGVVHGFLMVPFIYVSAITTYFLIRELPYLKFFDAEAAANWLYAYPMAGVIDFMLLLWGIPLGTMAAVAFPPRIMLLFAAYLSGWVAWKLFDGLKHK